MLRLFLSRRRDTLSLTYVAAKRLQSSNHNSGKSTAEEDKEEIERERLLRERFAQKVQGQTPGQNFQSDFNAAGGFPTAPGIPNPEAAQKVFRLLFYMSALLFLLLIVPLTDKNSPMFRMQGMPWWELPVGTSSCFLLLRILYPRSEENHIKEEFEAECKKNIYMTLDQFINWRYPHLFDGYRYNQAQVIATVAACLSAASDLKFAKTMYKAVGRNKDTKNSVDEVVDAIRREYSSLF